MEEENVEGESEGHDEDGENEKYLEESLQNLHEHHHVYAEEIKPGIVTYIITAEFGIMTSHDLPLKKHEKVEPGEEDGDGGALPLKSAVGGAEEWRHEDCGSDVE